MEFKIIEAEHGAFPGNWGKFSVERYTEEWKYRSRIDGGPLIRGRGWGPGHIWVRDIQTGEGAMFLHGGLASADLNKRRIWVCPLFEPFLEWLYRQDISDLSALPDVVQLPEAEFKVSGYRRPGPDDALRLAVDTLNLDEFRTNERTAVAAELLRVGADWLVRGLPPKDAFDDEPALLPLSEEDRATVHAALEALGEVYSRLTPIHRRGVVL